MRRLPILRVITGVALGIGVLWLFRQAPSKSTGDAVAPALSVDCERAQAQHNEFFAAALARGRVANAEVGGERRDADSNLNGAPSQPATKPPDRKKDLLRFNHDLASLTLHSPFRLVPEHVARHPVLNKRDVPLEEEQIRELDHLLTQYREPLWQLVKNYERARAIEVADLIDRGLVPEARRIYDDMHVRNMAWIKCGKDRKTFDRVYEELKRNPERIQPDVNYIQHRGKYYLWRDIKAMPRTDPMYEEIVFLGTEAVGVIGTWFEVHGYADRRDVINLIERTRIQTAADYRRNW